MEINISELPKEVQVKIPLTIRTLQQVYEYDELPSPIRKLIDPYIKKHTDIDYDVLYDIYPEISEFGDLQIVTDLKSLVVEYLRTYLLISPNDYPTDSTFGCRLKQYLNVRDTQTKRTLIQNEIENIINVLTVDLQTKIKLDSVYIETTSPGAYTEYHITINIYIESEPVEITLSVNTNS